MKKVVKDREEGKEIRDLSLTKKTSFFVIIGEDLYKRGFSTPLLKCVSKAEKEYVLQELHQGACGLHSGARMMETKVLRVGYYWATLRTDCADFCEEMCKLPRARSTNPPSPPQSPKTLTLPGRLLYGEWI